MAGYKKVSPWLVAYVEGYGMIGTNLSAGAGAEAHRDPPRAPLVAGGGPGLVLEACAWALERR